MTNSIGSPNLPMSIKKWLKPLILLGILGASHAYAADPILVNCGVDASNSDALATAINEAPDAAQLLISGTCRGSFTINNKTLTLTGEPTAAAPYPTLQANDADSSLLEANLSDGNILTLEGLTFSGGNYQVQIYGPIYNQAIGMAVIKDCFFTDFYEALYLRAVLGNITNTTLKGARPDSYNSGITLGYGTIVENFKNNTITDVFGSGITISRSTIQNFSNNTIYGVGLGVDLNSGAISSFSNNIVVGSVLPEQTYDIVAYISTIVSTGYNVIGNSVGYTDDNSACSLDNHSCFIATTGDVLGATVEAVNLQPITYNGGPTQTAVLGAASIAIGNHPNCANDTSLLHVDQRGAPRPGIGKTSCDAGAYETGLPQISIVIPAGATYGFLSDLGGIASGQTTTASVQILNSGNSPTTLSNTLTGSTNFVLAAAYNTLLLPMEMGTDALVYSPKINNQTTPDVAKLSISGTGGVTPNPFVLNFSAYGTGFVPSMGPDFAALINAINAAKGSSLLGVGKIKLLQQLSFNAFLDLIKLANKAYQKNNLKDACLALKAAYLASDGKPIDLVAGTARSTINKMISSIILLENCPKGGFVDKNTWNKDFDKHDDDKVRCH